VKIRLLKHREDHLDEINNKSSYKMITVREKFITPDAEKEGGEVGDGKENGKQDADLNSILKKRIEGIQTEMSNFSHNINDFAETCDVELKNLIGNINLLQRNMGYLNTQMKTSTERLAQNATNF